jgi:hypothetical protein
MADMVVSLLVSIPALVLVNKNKSGGQTIVVPREGGLAQPPKRCAQGSASSWTSRSEESRKCC